MLIRTAQKLRCTCNQGIVAKWRKKAEEFMLPSAKKLQFLEKLRNIGSFFNILPTLTNKNYSSKKEMKKGSWNIIIYVSCSKSPITKSTHKLVNSLSEHSF